MPAWQGKSKGNRLGYGIFVTVLRHGGVGPAYFLLNFVAFYYFLFSPNSSRAIADYFRRLGYPPFKAIARRYKNYRLLGQTIIDRIVLLAGIKNRFRFEFEGEEHLREMVALGRGGLLLSAHIGNWEIAGHLLQRLNAPVYIVMFDGEHEKLKAYLQSVTGTISARIIILREDLSHIYEISEALKNNGLVCIHADRYLEGNRTLKAKLLGSEALFPAGPFALATSFKVPVSFVFAMKDGSYDYHFYATPLKYAAAGDKEPAMENLLQEFAGAMEEKIRRYPDQWYNYYDFWKN